jgi:hypothetical protein
MMIMVSEEMCPAKAWKLMTEPGSQLTWFSKFSRRINRFKEGLCCFEGRVRMEMDWVLDMNMGWVMNIYSSG